MFIRPRRRDLLGLFMSLLVLSSAEARWVTRKPFVEEGGRLWYTDGRVLYRYTPGGDDWTAVRIEGFREGAIYDLGVDYGFLWLATDQGVYRFDLRLETSTQYGKDVLGMDRVAALAFGEDFVWIGGEGLLARFDIYLETWEVLDLAGRPSIGTIRDIVVEDRYIWLAAEAGIVRYDPRFDRIRIFSDEDGISSGEIRETFRFGEAIWFWGDQGLYRYEAGLETWEAYGAEKGLPVHDVREIVPVGCCALWLLSSETVFRFDAASGKWAPFVDVGRLTGRSLYTMVQEGGTTWFGTDDGLYGYEADSGEWDVRRKADGLTSNTVQELFLRGDMTFAVHREGIDVYDGEQWRGTLFSKIRRSGRARRAGIALEEGGLSIRDPRGNTARLGGRYRFSGEWERAHVSDEGWEDLSVETQAKIASILSAEGRGGRTWGGYYDNTDPDDLRFGGTYRGTEDDLLRRLSGGEIRTEAVRYGTSPFRGLSGSKSITGGEAQLRWGATRPYEVQFWGGRGRSRYAQEFFLGADGPLFRLAHRRLVPGTLQIRIDGEELDPRLYTVAPSLGLFFFLQERFVAPDSEIEAFYEYEDEDVRERVVRGQFGWETSEMFSLGANLLRRGKDAPEENLDLGEIYGQLRWRSAARDLDLKVIPELALSREGRRSGGAAQLHLIGAWAGLQFDGVWKEFGTDFRTIGQRKLAFGTPRRIADLSSRYEIRPYLPFDLAWRREEAEDGREDRWSAGMVLSRALWPQVALKVARGRVRSAQLERSLDQWTVRSRWDMAQLPLLAGRMDRLLVQGQYQNMHRESEVRAPSDSLAPASSTSQSAWLSVDLVPEDRLSSKADLWWSRSEDREENHRWIAQVHAYEFVPGILAFAQFDGERDAQFKGDLQDVSFDGTANVNGAVRPGTWFHPLRWMILYPRFTWSRRAVLSDVPRRWDLPRTFRKAWSDPLSAFSVQELRIALELRRDWSLTEIISREHRERHDGPNDRKDAAISRLDIHREIDRFLLRHEFIRTDTDVQIARGHDVSLRWMRRWSEVHRTDGEFRYRAERALSESHALTATLELFTQLEPRRFFEDIYLRPALSLARKQTDHKTEHEWMGRLRLDLDFLRALTQRMEVEAAHEASELQYRIYAQLRAEF